MCEFANVSQAIFDSQSDQQKEKKLTKDEYDLNDEHTKHKLSWHKIDKVN